MIELIVTTLAINYAIFTLGWFSVTCKHWVNLAELHHKHTAEFELKQAEAIIREEAVNLAREIDNLTKKEEIGASVEIIKVTTKQTEIKKTLAGFEGNKLEIFALSSSCYFAPDIMKYHKPTFPENSLSMN